LLWEVAGAALKPLGALPGVTGEVKSVAFSPDSKRLTAADSDGRVVVWEEDSRAADGKPVRVRQWQFPGQVNAVAFAPDGRHLATANGNGTAYILRVAPAPAREAHPPEPRSTP
jgi:WD40 repeat protein